MKRRLWIILALVTLMTLLFCGAALAASDYAGYCGAEASVNGRNMVWGFKGSTGELTISGHGAMAEFTRYDDMPWYELKDSVLTVTVESGVTSVSPMAFNYCSNLTRATIQSSVETIGYYAFHGCARLATVTVLASDCVIGGSDYDVFEDCPASLDLCGWTGSTAETYAAATNMTFKSLGSPNGSCGDSVTYSFDPVTSTLTISGTGAMANYSRAADVPWYRQREIITSAVIGDGITSIGDYAFSQCAGMTSIMIPDNVTNIGEYAFQYCTGLTSVTIPDGVSIIREMTFGASGLTDIIIPDGVTTIGLSAFAGTDLIDITIPESVNRISGNAFFNCSSLTSATITNSQATIDLRAFKNCSSLTLYGWTGSTAETYATEAGIPFVSIGMTGACGENVRWIFTPVDGALTVSGTGAMANYTSGSTPWNTFADDILTVVIEDGVTAVGSGAFYDCDGLVSVTLPKTMQTIGSDAFYNCFSLTDINLPDSLTRIDDYGFYCCSKLTDLTIPAGVTYLGNQAFRYCSQLKSITVLNKTMTFSMSPLDSNIAITLRGYPGSTAETYANNHSNVTFESVLITGACGDNVNYTFDPCTGEMAISGTGNMWDFSNTAPAWYDYTDKIIRVEIMDGVTSIGAVAFRFCSGMEQVVIPESVTVIDHHAFGNCSGLTSVSIPDSVTSIGDGAFYSCSGLTTVVIPASVNSLGYLAFARSENMSSVTIYNPETVIGDNDHDVFNYCSSSLTIKGWNPSTAKTYAEAAGHAFESLGSLSGSCGENVIYTFDPVTGTLTISGTGNMTDFSPSGRPWYLYLERITTVVIQDGVTGIGNNAFNRCSNLVSADIPDSIITINSYAFYQCANLSGITIPEGVTTIGNSAFYGCKALTSLTIPEGVTSIGTSSFSNCYGLTSVIIPGSVTNIKNSAFNNSYNLTSATVLNPNATLANAVFNNLPNTFTLRGWPSSTTETYATAVGHTFEALPLLTLPSALTAIEEDAFQGISALGVRISAGVSTISGNPFAGSGVQYILGVPGTAAQALADTYGYTFIPVAD